LRSAAKVRSRGTVFPSPLMVMEIMRGPRSSRPPS